MQYSIYMLDVKYVIAFTQWTVLFTQSSTTLITENHKNSGLVSVPETLNNSVEYLILAQNEITNITNTSLANYPTLMQLDMERNQLRYINDGSFDHNPKLQSLNQNSNHLRYIPATLGHAQHSLIEIFMWNSVALESVNLNFSKFPVLKYLNLGRNILVKFEASNLPMNLEELFLSFVLPFAIPNFQLYTPRITTIKLRGNNIFHIPDEYIVRLQLQKLDIRDNKLEAIPDLFDQPLKQSKIADNPLRCNASLCWLRLWSRKKTTVLKGIESTSCQSPSYLTGKRLLDIDPVKMGCYSGEHDLSIPTQQQFAITASL